MVIFENDKTHFANKKSKNDIINNQESHLMYDHITFHSDGTANLSNEQAIAHMVYYYTWAVEQNLHSSAAAALPEFAAWQQGSLSGSQFILQALNGGLDETCFNDWGNRFTRFYYDDEDEGYGRFMTDYFVALGLNDEMQFYQVGWLPENQQRLNVVFQATFEHWQASLK